MQFSVRTPRQTARMETLNRARAIGTGNVRLSAMRPSRPRATPLAVAVAAVLANSSALALSLGPIEVSSALGEPLRAELALGVAPGERITPECFRLSTDASAGARAGMPYEANLQVLGSGPARRLTISGRTPLREPFLDLVVAVECAGVPRLQRGYTLLLSPAGLAAPARSASAAAAATPAATPAPSTSPAGQRSGPVSAPSAPPARPSTPIPDTLLSSGEPYRVRPGDTLSTIAARVSDRELSIWAQADAIFAANPGAFINADPNRLRAGSVLEIPLAAGRAEAARSPRPREALAEVTPRLGERPEIARATPVAAALAVTAGPGVSSARQAAEAMGPPRPERLIATTPVPAPVPAPQALATAATATTVASADASGGLRGWLAGLLVGLGFISLGALLGWTALRRRPSESDDAAAHADLETTIQAGGRPQGVRLTPPPSFDRELHQTGSYTVEMTPPDVTADDGAAARATGRIDDTPTDEVAVLDSTAETNGDDAFDALLTLTSDDDIGSAAAAAAALPAAPANPRAGDTTIEHRFEGFSATQALDMQMAEAMAMLEQDYTSRFEAAVSLDESREHDATDTLHALPGDVTQSLEDLRLQAGDDTETPHGEDDEGADTQERTALMETPQGRVGTG